MRTLEEIAAGVATNIKADLDPAARWALAGTVAAALREAVAQERQTPEDAGCYICGKRNRGEHGHETFYLCPEHPNVHLHLRAMGAAQERAALREFLNQDRPPDHEVIAGFARVEVWLDAREKEDA